MSILQMPGFPDGKWNDWSSDSTAYIICQHDCGDTQIPTSSTTTTSNTGTTTTDYTATTTLFSKITNPTTTQNVPIQETDLDISIENVMRRLKHYTGVLN